MPRFLVEKPRARFALEKFLGVARDMNLTGDCIDVGCGTGDHIAFIKERGPFRSVHGLSLGPKGPKVVDRYFSSALEDFDPGITYQGIWCCHALEHSPNPGIFLRKLRSIAADRALICITVPPLRHDITTGHLTMWDGGTLLLNLVKAGFDCSEASVRRSGYNISVILRYARAPDESEDAARTDIEIRRLMPEAIVWRRSLRGVNYFNGNIRRMNWD